MRVRRAPAAPPYSDAQLLAFGLAGLRVVWGVLQFLNPGLVDRSVSRRRNRAVGTVGSRVGWRMKGARDLALGWGYLCAPPTALDTWTRAGMLVDIGDAVTMLADHGRTMRAPVALLGPVAAMVAVVAGVAATDRNRRPATRQRRPR